MTLPNKPERSTPIPNQPFSSPEVTQVKGPYWYMDLGEGLEPDGQGSIQTSGSTPSEPSAMLYGPNGFVGLGTGLELGPNGEVKTTGGGFIYCTPQYSHLPVSYPPYNCSTEVNTQGVINFANAWANCTGLGEFPCIDTSSATSFAYTWAHSDITSLPVLNTHSVRDFSYSFYYCGYLGGNFPVLDFHSAESFEYTWTRWDQSGEPLQFSEGCFDTCYKDGLVFGYSFYGCKLTEQSLDNIITSLNNTGSKAGTLWLRDVESSNPSLEVINGPVLSLFDKGWDIFLPDGTTPAVWLDPLNYQCSTSVDPTGLTRLVNAWSSCPITSFPSLDVSSCANFFGTWSYCSLLNSFPTLDVSSGVNFGSAWKGCSQLTSFPLLNVSSGTNFSGAWAVCSQLTSFPLLDVSSGINFNYAWFQCSGLTSFPTLDVSSGTNFGGAWNSCSSLTSFPLLDLSSGINFNSTWFYCSNLTSFPALDLSKGTIFGAAWFGCSNLTSFPEVNVSSGTSFVVAWQNCTSLTSFPALNFSSGTYFRAAWQNCTSLTSFPPGVFDSCSATNFNSAWFNCALDQTSVDNILVSLDTAGQSNGVVNLNGGTSAAPSATGLSAKASLEAKGWTVVTN